MKALRLLVFAAMLAYGAGVSHADSLKVKFTARALIDATATGYGKEDVQGYYHLEDCRAGFFANYGNYEMIADLEMAGKKFEMKVLLLNYHFKNGVLSFGNGYEPFSMDMLISTTDMRFNQMAPSVTAFTNSPRLGITYHYYDDHWYLATGLYTHNDMNRLRDEKKNALVSTTRAVWRKRNEAAGKLLHVGGGFSYRTKEVNKDNPSGSISSPGVTSLLPEPMYGAEFDGMGSELKGIVEALYTSRKVLLQGEYFYDRMNRTGGRPAYNAHGGYVQGSYLLKGNGFYYDAMYGIPGRPLSDRAVELVARFNYTDLNDNKSGIYGGEGKDFSLGVNFYLNKYVGLKLNGSYVWVGAGCNSFYDKDFFLAQARIQYIF